MQCDGCDGCGKTYPELKQIFFCKCFLAGFCSPECFEQSGHLQECELISGPASRLRGTSYKTNFSDLLRSYAELLKIAAISYLKNKIVPTVNELNELTDRIELLDAKRQEALLAGLRKWNRYHIKALQAVLMGRPKDAMDPLMKAKNLGQAVISIFKEENRLSLRQFGKDIERAWTAYTNALHDAIMASGEDDSGLAKAYARAQKVGFDSGRTLSGGKSVGVAGEAELIEGPISTLRGKNNYGEHLAKYTMDLEKYATATEDPSPAAASAATDLDNITKQVKDTTRKGQLKTILELWHTMNIGAIDDMLAGNKDGAKLKLAQTKSGSNTVIAIFKSENRLSLRQKGKDIENAWNSYLEKLSTAILSVEKKGESQASAKTEFANAAMHAARAGQVLGGGKDVDK